jgi:hyperosmotically inducible protein
MKLLAIALAAGSLLAAKDVAKPALDPLTDKVRHELVMLPYFGVFDDISFRMEGSTAILSGSVTRPVLKSSAVNVVKKIEGVDQVIDNIEVLPLSGFDDRLRIATYRAVYGDSALSPRYALRPNPPIRIVVKNGNIRLTGFVANQGDRNIAGIRARSVAGAFSVENALQLDNN